MKLYKVKSGLIIESDNQHFLLENEDWDSFFNDDNLYQKMSNIASTQSPISNGQQLIETEVEAPVVSQEIWASGVTYYNSKLGREEEAKDAGGGEFYARVYVAERPELFFKATARRTVGHGGNVRIRKDSTWDVPEPELTLAMSSSGKIIGYSIGNDMSSRSIEGENPLYLPQAKTYDGCAALGPCVYVTENPLPPETEISLSITRNGAEVFSGNIAISQIVRKFEDLAEFLYRETSFPHGSYLMTGTGIVPGTDFTLQSGDEVTITILPIGSLTNIVS